MSWFSDISAALAFSQLVLLTIYFLVNYAGKLSRLISLFSICIAAYMLLSMSFVAGQPISIYLLFRLATLTPFILWFISFLLFVDNGKVHFSVWIAISFFVVARGIGIGVSMYIPEIVVNNLGFTLVHIIPQMIILFFSGHSIYLALSGYDNDLVEQRRQLRRMFVICAGILLIAIIGTDFINLFQRFTTVEIFTRIHPIPRYVLSLYIFCITLLFFLRVFRLDDDALTLVPDSSESVLLQQKSAVQHTLSAKPGLFQRIVELMEKERLYAKTGLTISDLAKALSFQEYRVRRLINKELGYRNFNQFLNNYRIEDASTLLKETSIPISSIAFDVGYASISVFNKAFKDRCGITPSEYRNANQPVEV